jgi:membrane-associated HD superfamily phosphohydrolase
MKLILALTALITTAPLLPAQYVVTNPISDILSETLHLEDIANQVEMINNQVQQIQTLTQQLQQVQAYVKAFGDPEQLLQITGADHLIGSLQQSGVGQTIGQLQQIADGAQALSYDANGLYQSLGATFQTPGGVEMPRAEELYRKFGAIQQGSQNFQAVTDDVLSRRESLRQQIATTTQQLQASTTDAETQKLTGVLVGYDAELQAVDREIDQAAAQLAAQDIENRADRERQEQARREERQAQMEEGTRRFGEVFRLDASAPAFPSRR